MERVLSNIQTVGTRSHPSAFKKHLTTPDHTSALFRAARLHAWAWSLASPLYLSVPELSRLPGGLGGHRWQCSNTQCVAFRSDY